MAHSIETEQSFCVLRLTRWKNPCDAFLQNVLKLGPSVNSLLFTKWIDDCKNLADNTPGRRAFTNTTIKAVQNQLNKVEHAKDPNNIDMYIEIAAGKASSHGLSKWQSKHPESALEKDHKSLAHYANGRCALDFGDILTLGGMAVHNVRRHWMLQGNSQQEEKFFHTLAPTLSPLPIF
jgi:hypothetical protein